MVPQISTLIRPSRTNHRRKGSSHVRSLLVVAVLALGLVAPASARDIKYCSSVNTGEDNTPLINTFYQTNGLCYDHCVLDPANAFAIVQGSYCWCSTYVPATTTTGCDQSCPGFLADMCGNSDTNVYGYMALSGKPKGTKGADTSTVSPISASIVQIVSTVTAEGSTQTQTIIYIIASKTSSTKSTTLKTSTRSSEAATTTDAAATTTSAQTSTSNPAQSTAASVTSSDGFFSNAGRAAGLIIGIIFALVLIVAGVLLYRRQQNRKAALYGSADSAVMPVGGAGFFGAGRRSRSMSTLGLVGEKSTPILSTPPTGLSGVTQPPQTAGGTTPQAGEVYDQRMDPSSLFMRYDHQTGSSRMSVRSLRDEQDYSRRVLRLANPDNE